MTHYVFEGDAFIITEEHVVDDIITDMCKVY